MNPKITWQAKTNTPIPFNTRIIATDGEVCVIGQLTKYSLITFDPEGVDGCEFEVFDHSKITHWMPAPELP